MFHRWEGPPGFDMTKRAWLWCDGNATFEITIKNVRKGSNAVRKISRIFIPPTMYSKNPRNDHTGKLCPVAVCACNMGAVAFAVGFHILAVVVNCCG